MQVQTHVRRAATTQPPLGLAVPCMQLVEWLGRAARLPLRSRDGTLGRQVAEPRVGSSTWRPLALSLGDLQLARPPVRPGPWSHWRCGDGAATDRSLSDLTNEGDGEAVTGRLRLDQDGPGVHTCYVERFPISSGEAKGRWMGWEGQDEPSAHGHVVGARGCSRQGGGGGGAATNRCSGQLAVSRALLGSRTRALLVPPRRRGPVVVLTGRVDREGTASCASRDGHSPLPFIHPLHHRHWAIK